MMTNMTECTTRDLCNDYPFIHDFFSSLNIKFSPSAATLGSFIEDIPQSQLEPFSLTKDALLHQCIEFVEQMLVFQANDKFKIVQVTIKAGFDKSGVREKQDIELRCGEVICVVGPTGSGKSQLLADIESLAQLDTPSKRQVLLNHQVPDEHMRMSGDQQLVAQLSQNMNFVMDLSVEEFITMHAESRMVKEIPSTVTQVYELATDLAGEPFTLNTPVTALSGGQSRALMIADVACLSASPIVLIDEIENAGVDRRRALELLVKKEKMVLMATHDPLLALSGDRRIIIRNGGIAAVLETSEQEKLAVSELVKLDAFLGSMRNKVRLGERIAFDLLQAGLNFKD
ncbi:ATP-binding cassette domain-containing protein [Vibrio sp.]|nr:ATP-binding cassette domain-containing protein [Vibrio sp.]